MYMVLPAPICLCSPSEVEPNPTVNGGFSKGRKVCMNIRTNAAFCTAVATPMKLHWRPLLTQTRCTGGFPHNM